MYKVLVVESNIEFHSLISQSLLQYELSFVTTVEEAILKVKADQFDGILVDLKLPERSRMFFLSDVLKDERFDKTPVLCMGDVDDIAERVLALEMGVDDVLIKPFNPLEFRARVENKIKKSIKLKSESQITAIGNMSIDHTRHRVLVRNGQTEIEVPVTQTEFKLLTCLARTPEQVYSREQLLASAWGDEAGVLERVVDVHICLLRKKLGEKCSHTVKALSGVGYKLTANRKLLLGA